MFGLFLFTLKLVCSAFGCLLLLRAYMRFMCTPSNDPLYAFCYSLTEWAVRSASTFIKRRGNIDWPSIFVCYLVAVLYQFFHWLFPLSWARLYLLFIGQLSWPCGLLWLSAFSLG